MLARWNMFAVYERFWLMYLVYSCPEFDEMKQAKQNWCLLC